MSFLNFTTKIVSISLTVILLLGLNGWGIYHIRTLTQKSSELLNSANQVAQENSEAKTIRTLKESVGGEGAALQVVALTESGVVRVIESVESVGRALGLETEIISVDKSAEKTTAPLQKIRLSLNSVGSWGNNFSFLNAVENLPHKIVIERAAFSKNEPDWRLQLTMVISTFETK